VQREVAHQAAEAIGGVRGVDEYLARVAGEGGTLIRDRGRPRAVATRYVRLVRTARRSLALLPPSVAPLLEELAMRVSRHRRLIRAWVEDHGGEFVDPSMRWRACGDLWLDLMDSLTEIESSARAMSRQSISKNTGTGLATQLAARRRQEVR
jgi:hypothetical protein